VILRLRADAGVTLAAFAGWYGTGRPVHVDASAAGLATVAVPLASGRACATLDAAGGALRMITLDAPDAPEA
jgi:hypothetical protein